MEVYSINIDYITCFKVKCKLKIFKFIFFQTNQKQRFKFNIYDNIYLIIYLSFFLYSQIIEKFVMRVFLTQNLLN